MTRTDAERVRTFRKMLTSRWNVWGWRDVVDVLCLRLPPYRWRRSVPLPKFHIGYRKGVWCFGMWGIRLGNG